MKLLILMAMCDRSEEAIICALPKAGFEVHLVCSEAVAVRPAIKACGAKIYIRDFGGRFDLSSVFYVRALVKELGIDCVYAPRNNTLGVGVLASIGLKNRLIGYRGTTHHLRWYDPASLLTYLNPRVDRIVCVSDAVKQFLLDMGLPEARLIRIYKGHDIAWYSGLTKPSRQELGIPEDVFTVCFTGNIRPVKGCDYLLEAMRLIPSGKKIMVVIVGESRDEKVNCLLLEPGIREKVRFLGYRKDAAAIAGMCDVFVMPSIKREGLPRSVIEAMAQGIPAIVSRVGGMPELVEDGKSGIVVAPCDPNSLADAIIRMQSDAGFRTACSQNARKRIEQDFNINRTIEQYAMMFKG